MKKIGLLTILMVTGITNAQINLTGFVKDSIGNPLEMANVLAINKTTKKIASYGFTDSKGRYKLSLGKNDTFNIKISYIGMKSADFTVETKEANIKKDVTLKEDNMLDEINIVSKMPVTIKGDTIIYNADSFKNGTERKLGDVLKKIPGMEVNDEGEIEVEGKAVGKVMVDGKDFFDGDSKLATKNIPANAIDKVQVLKNYGEVSQLRSVQNNQDNVAINIKLKEGKKNFWFGDITAGAGDAQENSLYLFQPKLFYYSPKYSINIIGDLNNIGEVAFTRRDFFNFSGGFRNPSRSSGTNINLGDNSLGFATLQNNRAKEINTKFGAANFSYSPTSKLDVSGFTIFSSNQTDIQIYSDRTITNQDASGNDVITQESKETNTAQKSDLAMAKFSSVYKPNVNNQLDYDILARVSKESQNNGVFSNLNGMIAEVETSKPYSINQNVNYYYTLNEKNIFAAEVQSLIKDEDPFYNAILENDASASNDSYDGTAAFLGFDRLQQNYDINQQKRVKSNQLDAKVDYWNVINRKSNINLTLGTIYSKQNFDSNLFQSLDNNSVFNPTTASGENTNDIGYTFSDVYLGVHYRFITGIFTFTPGFSAHSYIAKNSQFNTTYKDDFFRFLPDFNVRIQLKKSENLNFTYRMQTQFTDVNKFAQGYVLNSYSSIFSGKPDLENALSHNLNLSYFSFNMFNFSNVSAFLNYTKSIDNIRTSFIPVAGNNTISINSPINLDLPDESLTGFGRFQRTFKKIRGTANARLSYSKFNVVSRGNPSARENFSQNYNFSLGTNFRKAPNVEIGYRYSIQDNDQGNTRAKFFTNAPSINFDAFIWEKVTFKANYSYNSFSDENVKLNEYQFLDASISYRKNNDAKWEYE
ncbi:MAG: carboxypeptidase-like regulatory domain-containing protein, partial [Polaribacter sp.]